LHSTKMLRVSLCVLIVLACAYSARATGWGATGHQVTAGIGQTLLTDNTASQVSDILDGQALADVATWADTIKYSAGYTWSAQLHYVDTPDWVCNFKKSRDCSDSRCVVGALYNYTDRLGDASLPDKQIQEALKFLTHFAGDIHQPLHVGFVGDEGGNSITGKYDGKSTNLHSIWDTSLINDRLDDDFNGDQDQWLQYLIAQVNGNWSDDAAKWAKCKDDAAVCPDDWAEESIETACSNAYTDQDGNEVEDGFSFDDSDGGYYDFNKQVVDIQIAKGGVRLAHILNSVLDPSYTVDQLIPSRRAAQRQQPPNEPRTVIQVV